MARENFPESGLPIRRTIDLLPQVFKTEANEKFMSAVVDPLVQPGVLQKTVGYIGRRYGKTYTSSDVYLDDDATLRSRYQLEPGVVSIKNNKIDNFYDYIDFKNQIKFFGNYQEKDYKLTEQDHYSWDPPIDWDKFVNYREYYWVPSGPPAVKILGQTQDVVSTYRVTLGLTNTYIFSPDGFTNNPTITLYRGQTYKFQVNVPGNGMMIRTAIDTGSLLYNPIFPYSKGQLTVFDGKIWRALNNIPANDGSTIDENTQDWELVDDSSETTSALDYIKGITNNGIENGTITFTVPYDAPDVLFYQSFTDPNRFGRFLISNIESNTKIDVEKEIIGKQTYTSSNGVTLSNGMVVYFIGQVTPSKYSDSNSTESKWVVEGVGEKITLTRFSDLVVSPNLTQGSLEILFDNSPFDTQPFDDASAYPNSKDYITINRGSQDSNPWSRYNRWFHRSVLDYANEFNGTSFEATESIRAKRPIIEFLPNIQLFNHGSRSKQYVDFIDRFTTDVFSDVEGSQGYIVDGEPLFEGARLLIVNDTDSLANNKIYEVTFITHNNIRQISLRATEDSESAPGDCVLVRRGNDNKGFMFHFDGSKWIQSQIKNSVNQPPMFDLFDSDGVSFADADRYPVSSFIGSKIVLYKQGTGPVDKELGFSLSYLNIDNVGDIQFEYDLDSGKFDYSVDRVLYSKNYNSGFFKINGSEEYRNGWLKLDSRFAQPIIDSVKINESTNTFSITPIDWNQVDDNNLYKVLFFVNGNLIKDEYTRDKSNFTFNRTFNQGDIISVKVFSDVDPDTGYYEIPVGLEKNPLNQKIESFTLGQASDHLYSGLELIDTFDGKYPGSSNLRDITGYKNLTKRFLKHSGLAPLSIMLLCDKQNNIIKSIQYAKKSYTEFKNTFIKLADEMYFDQNPNEFVDTILNEFSKTKDESRPFSNSDMIGSGAYTSIDYEVEDTGIKTFALSEKFDLDTLSQRAVYVYVNDQQLLHNRDYTFNSTFGFVNLSVDLSEGDMIQIREYVSTGFNFIPPTPTKLGIYKKYVPRKFLDNTYVEPVEVIQGHDGSITVAYGDFRDDVLLELEYRIYNNIKQQYDESIFDNDSILGGYYGNALYTKQEADVIFNTDFLRFIADTNIDYINNTYFDSENSFTYTYSNMTDPTGSVNLPGYWRGVYQHFYDTARPHTCPWEMLGFSEKPTWWESEYGPAPYTSNNLILWEDIRDGIIRQGPRAGSHSRYKRPSILRHLPVDGDGNLLSPLDSGLAGNFTLINNKGSFVFGDNGPVEYSWRTSSEWPFAVSAALCLLKPFEFISDNFNRSNLTVNILNQTVNKLTETFISIDDLIFENSAETPVSGLLYYLRDYSKNYSIPLSELKSDVTSIDIRLSNRLSGFVDQQQQKYILDSKSPKSTSGNIFVPPENYDIIFNVSSPITSLSYSGLVIEKTSQGWKITGYDFSNPYFLYYEAVASTTDPVISVGGISENFLDWQEDKFYGNGVVVRYKNTFYRSISSHNSGSSFDSSVWKQLPSLPLVNSVNAQKRRTFNRLAVKRVLYGQLFISIQQVVDFILGYQEYLKDQGFVFENYDGQSQTVQDWFTSAKEFMFWSKHNWSTGSLLTLSPAASYVQINTGIGVADNILDSFYDYSVLKNDGTPLNPTFINVTRDFKSFKMTTVNTNEGIYYLRLNFVLKEHVTVFNDRTVFNDVIYDKTTGYRQERIKSRGFRTVDWDGDYTSPGFLFDNVDIQNWQPFTDYKLGDIVSYKSYYWTSKENQLGSTQFDDSKWTKLDSNPTKQLLPNFDYRINQFEDYYEVDTDGVGSSQRNLARHAVGYQQRDYLQNLAEDEISQFRLYQGFIREKGTANSIVKIFDKLSKTDDDSVVLNEEWAFKIGQFGGTDQIQISEFNFEKGELVLNPQPIIFSSSVVNQTVKVDQYLRLGPDRFTVSATPFTKDINPKSEDKKLSRNAGYVKIDTVEHIVKTRDDLLTLDIAQVKENDHIWITFDDWTWTVLRYNEALSLRIIDIKREGENELLILNRPATTVSVGDIIGITYVANLTGFYRVVDKGLSTLTVKSSSKDDALIEDSTSAVIGLLTEVRIDDYQAVDPQQVAILGQGTKLWVDNNGSGIWEVVEKNKVYSPYLLTDYGITDPRATGSAVVYVPDLAQVITSLPGSTFVMSYSDKVAPGYNNLTLQQALPAPDGFETAVDGVFGEALAVSPDSKWLAIGSPNASGVRSKYMGELTPDDDLLAGETVLFNGKLWEAQTNINKVDGSTINFDSQDWAPSTLLTANSTGRAVGYTKQGMISLYKFQNQQWEHQIDIISPRPHALENFGSSITFGVSGSKYYMAVSASGSLDRKGRVYLYQYDGTEWKHLEDTRYAGLYNTGAEFEGTITTNVLTVDAFVQGNIQVGMIISGTDIPEGTTITRRIEDPVYIKYELNYDPPTTSLILSSRRITGIVKYPKGSVVWSDGSMWEALQDLTSDGSSITIDSVDWQKLDPISTSNSLPKNIALEDDGSTLAYGLLEPDDFAELVKENDGFGRSLAMNRDGSVLVIGAPSSDSQYFANYRGLWKDYQEYTAGDVVLFQDGYHRLEAIDLEADSLNTSKGDYPDAGYPWVNVGDSTINSTGKIYIYRRNSSNIFKLTQTITPDVLAEINDSGATETIGTGDQFGFSIDLDSNGTTLVVSSPQADVFKQNQGSVYLFKYNGEEFRLTQKLTSFEDLTNEYFGSSVSISSGTERIVVGARNSAYSQVTGFEAGISFDKGRTSFSDPKGFPGQVYVYERKDQGYFLVEKLETDLISGEAFGFAVDCTKSSVAVGSPRYEVDGIQKGILRVFKKDESADSLSVIQQQENLIDLDLLKNIELYDAENYVKIADVDVVDPFKLKILGIAEQELTYKTIYDPAIYMKGIVDLHNIDESQCWFEKNVGKVWWDLAAVKFVQYEQSDIAYRIGHWNEQAEGSSVDIYEWVESPLLPSEWSILADTVEGLAEGISGQPKYPDDTVYNTKVFFNPSTGQQLGTKYYYWVKNKSTLPEQPTVRRIPCSTIIDLIENPIGSGYPFVAVIDSDKLLAYNFLSNISSDIVSLNIEWYKTTDSVNLIHREYQLLTEGVADSLPTEYLERKWIDSLVGYDQSGNQVPDPELSEKQRYGIAFRPRQTMFANRAKALKITIDNINSILTTRPFTDLINFGNLESKDPLPSSELNEYDVDVETYIDLQQVGTVRIRQALFSVNIINGQVDTIDIVDPGFGYRTTPFIEIEGDGIGARAQVTIDNQGKIKTITLLSRGRKYNSAIVKIRPFSVLVRSDSTASGFWSIYGYDQQRRIFYRRKSQGFDTTLYWEYIDWYAIGYSAKSKINKEIQAAYQLPSLIVETGTVIRIKEYAEGGWALVEKVVPGTGTLFSDYNLVGRQGGTLRIKETLYDQLVNSLGYDAVGSYDASVYDLQPIQELRNILAAAKEDIFVDDLRVEWNKLFFAGIRYAFSERLYVDWAFKTSFLNAIHNVGQLEKKANYKNDNLEAYQQYIEEVKPYRTSIREYTSRYTDLDNTYSVTTDFDLPPSYSIRDGQILPVNQAYNRFDEYPWKFWTDNNGYSIVEIKVSNPGSGYKNPPTVLIEGNGSGATAQAFIANGGVSGIRVINQGSGYTSTVTVTLVGGNGTNQDIAKAVAIIGSTPVRTFDMNMKFDRISKAGIFESYNYDQTFVATGFSAVFDLTYAPTRDKNRITIYKNSQIVLKNEYSVNLYYQQVNGNTVLRGKIIFVAAPNTGDVIEISYDKNDELFDSVNRIDRYYAPLSGMKGKEMNQLMTGIDYGGVQVQGTTFDVTGGWDALPWFTDNWDSVEGNSDFYYVADGSTTFVVLPYVPADGQLISIYIKRAGESRATRIDDPFYNNYDGSTPQPNGRVLPKENVLMPTFVGDGSTNFIELHDYLRTYPGDTLIFRTLDSDGSVTITDVNLLDTRVSGGTLENVSGSYSTATGMTPEEIVIDGNEFISPDAVPATEENIPGQVLESLSLKIYSTTDPGAAPLSTKIAVGDGSTTVYPIGLTVMTAESVLVYVNKIRKYVDVDFALDLINNTIELITAPSIGDVVEIISIGIGGVSLIDYQEFVADGETSLFLTKADYDVTTSVLVTVDGEIIDTGFVNSSDFIDTPGRTLIQFGTKPAFRQVIKIVSFGTSIISTSDSVSFIRINQQNTVFDGSTRSIPLSGFINTDRGSAQSSILVNVNGNYLLNVDTTYVVYDGTNNNITIGVDPAEAVGSITSGDIKVFVNNELQRFVIDYTFNGNENLIQIPAANLEIDDIIKIESNTRSLYSIEDDILTISSSVSLTEGDEIEITWFSEYPTMDLISDEFTGGQVQYRLDRTPLDINYIWVYKNGQRLTRDRDYSLSLPRAVVYLTEPTTSADKIKIVQFSSIIYKRPRAFEIFKDMLNNYHYKRFSRVNELKLLKDLNYYDTTIEVSNADMLSNPIPSRSVPGVVIINNERIEYFAKQGNILSQLRRGSLGTAIAELHPVDSYVIDVGATETIPYNETQEKIDFVSDGSTVLIGPLEFVPTQSVRSGWYKETIPNEYGPCDTVEVFVGGRRLRKDPVEQWAEENGPISPEADIQVEAEFSVDGLSPYVRLTSVVPAGTRISIIRKQGRLWYERGQVTASKGISLFANSTAIADFIGKKTTEIPE